ncbi:MAG TPA: aminotransferase class I/II-fold pyridoxal phosphate-dependent enzyme [Fodinibius sp.]|nr:aminotransferase class I/II-fold pyridoxal phosphate-dependent enzyme [Fodinibius sp.]
MDYSAQRIYLSAPHMGGNELDYIQDAFKKNWIAPLGENVDGFEKDLQTYTHRSHAAVVTSGTAALHLALILCGVEAGDEVLCQSLTFAATANPIRYQGATPVFVDSEAETWNMDPQLLEQAILDRIEQKNNPEEKPKAIIVVHLYGMPAKMGPILRVANKYNIPVIEDAAEALGSSIDGKRCGSFGKLSALSFNGNKIITTSGGGALLGSREALISRARFLATQARDQAPHYQHSELGYNYRMSNIVAGIGRGQIKVLDKHISRRRFNHKYYFEELKGNWLDPQAEDQRKRIGFSENNDTNGIYFLKEPEGYFSNRWLSTILINPQETGGVSAEHIRLALEQENIECRPLWKPMHLQPLYQDAPYYGHGLSDTLFQHGLCLPSGSSLTTRELSKIVSCIKASLK